jgi:kynurenine 3-monooxygenase
MSTYATQRESNMEDTVIIAGAGPVGCLAACYMAKRGYNVEMFEGRKDSRKEDITEGRSINLALSNRAFKALEVISPKIVDDLHANGIKMFGRYVHLKDGSESFQPYGREDQYILSVGRRFLNEYLLTFTESFPNVKIHFHEKVTNVDLSVPSVTTKNQKNVKARFIIGADGIHSVLRQTLQEYGPARMEYQQHFMTHSYKELILPPTKDGDFALRPDSLHIWPRHDFMLIALPNPTKDFTVTLFLREKTDLKYSPYSFENLDTDDKVLSFLNKEFPDFVKLVPNLLEVWHENPKSPLMWLKCYPHHFQDKVLLIGDAAHAIIPFYGQGVNAGFEDCRILNEILDKNNLAQSFAEYTRTRKPATDAICELSEYNFTEMSSSTASTFFVLYRKFGIFLNKLFPSTFIPLYTMVTFSPEMSYDQAWNTYKNREKRMKWLGSFLFKSAVFTGLGFGFWYGYNYIKKLPFSK